MSVPMKLQHVPASRGAAWVRQGFRAFALRPMAFAALLAAFLFGMVLLAQVPLIGPLVLIASLPVVSLVFMLATQMALRGESPTPALFAAPFRVSKAQTASLLQLGALYTVGTVAVMLISHWADGGQFAAVQDMMAPGSTATPEQVNARLEDSELQFGFLVRLGLASLLSLPFWHAPALVHFAGQSAAKSLFFSTVAVWRNLGAFTVYGLTCAAGLIVFGLVASLLLAVIGMPQLGMVIVAPAGLLAATVFYASLFFTFVDSFEASLPSASGPTP